MYLYDILYNNAPAHLLVRDEKSNFKQTEFIKELIQTCSGRIY